MSDQPFRSQQNRMFISFFFMVSGLTAILADNDTTSAKVDCSLVPVDDSAQKEVNRRLTDESTYLISYKFLFPKRSSNPLFDNLRYVYKPNSYNRVSKKHGQTLLSLAFNYGVISLMTLTFGTTNMDVDVHESPPNCLDGKDEEETLNIVLYLLARDFDYTNKTVAIKDEQRICLQYIEARNGVAYFKPRCYSSDTVSSKSDPHEIGNRWIDGLYALMAVIKVLLVGFGPVFFIGYVETLSQESLPYIVKLQEPLLRTLFIAKTSSEFDRVRGDRILNLSKCRGFPKLKQILENAPLNRPFLAEISEYDIVAAYNRLIMENEVPVTFWGAIAEAIFRCKMKNVGPMQSCCYVDMCRSCPCVKRRRPWISLWTKVGNILLILFLPFLYYLRLILFYLFEVDELRERRAASRNLSLVDSFDNSLIHYLSPTHWVFIAIYAIYFVSAFTLAYMTRAEDEGRFRSIVVGSFADLRRLSYLRVFQLMVENFLWPFKRFGIFGCCVAIFYFPIALPLTFIVYIFYSIPTIYLTFRMLFYSRHSFLEQIRTRSGVRKYQVTEREDTALDLFQVDYLCGGGGGGAEGDEGQPTKLSEIDAELDEMERFRTDGKKEKRARESLFMTPQNMIQTLRVRPTHLFHHMLASIMCILSLYALLIIVAECFGSLVEIAVFTMMGVIVNAQVSVKYAGLIIMLIVYTYDCFNNIHLRYLKLNKALFYEIKGRVKGLNDVTRLPSYLQENQAFKSEEQSEQGANENPDDIAEQPSRHWLINDLVLFVDNEDAFRIPRRLFKQVCQIRVAGVPGPIYEGVLEAVYHFIKMVLFVIFVFMVVLSFGDVYELSSTTQMMAVLAVGFLPVVLKTFMEPKKPDIEVNSLSFKSKLDEVIKNFWQIWPIQDFTFTPLPDDPDARVSMKLKSDVNENGLSESSNVSGSSNVGESSQVGEKKSETAVAWDSEPTPNSWSPFIQRFIPSILPATSGQDDTTENNDNRNNEDSSNNNSNSNDDGNINNNNTVYLVDLLIQLPRRYEDEWVDGWSNIIQVKEEKKKRASDVAEAIDEKEAEQTGAKV